MVSMKAGRTPSFSFPRANGPEARLGENRDISVRNPFWATKSGYFLTSPRHMTSDRVVETHHTFHDHVLDALSSSMVLRYDGSNVGMVLFLHCFQAVFFPWHGRNDSIQVRYLVLLMVDGNEQTDWPMQYTQSVAIA